MFFSFLKLRTYFYARRLFFDIFEKPYSGEVFVYGGAFNPLHKQDAIVNDIDLYVRDRKNREKLVDFLIGQGAVLEKDFYPYCIKLRKKGCIIEVTYRNLKDGTLNDLFSKSDLSTTTIGAYYAKGAVRKIAISKECRQSMRYRIISIISSELAELKMVHPPNILVEIHRMEKKAQELDYAVNQEHKQLLWELFENAYSEEERLSAVELYLEILVSYKKQYNSEIVQRAAISSDQISKMLNPENQVI